MLQVLRRGRRWLISATIFLVGGVFVFYLSGSGGGQGAVSGALVELGDRRYSAFDLQRFYRTEERRFRERLGDGFDSKILGQYIERAARDQLVNAVVLAHEAERMGLHVSDEEVRRLLRELFRNANGTFDPEYMRNYARREYGSETLFVREVRDELLAGKLIRLVNTAGLVSKAEARQALRYQGEEVQVAYVLIEPSGFEAGLEISEEAIAATLTNQVEHLRTNYDAQSDRFDSPEKVRARHILFRVYPSANDEVKAAIRAEAERVLQLVRDGGDFADLARKFSDDPSAEKGGDLGFFSRGQMVSAFEEVAFTLETGSTSGLVETEFGFHILRVEEKRAPVEQSFDEVARLLAEEHVRKNLASEKAQRLTQKLSDEVAQGESLTDAARAQGLTLERPDWLAHNVNGTIEGLGTSPELLDAVFALPSDATSSPRIFELGGGLVLVERTGLRTPSDEEIAAQIKPERDRLLQEWRQQAQGDWIAKARESLVEQGLLKVLFDPLEGSPPT